MRKSQKTVFVGLSGGVDSSVSAALLKKGGFKVVGVHLRCWNVDGCADQDAEDARRAAETLDIPFYVFDFEEEYKKRVVNYMVEGYRRGITPNPDVMCNHEIKFGLFSRRAMQMGADFVATGHYARISSDFGRSKKLDLRTKKKTEWKLLAGKDKNKDQSYFLWLLSEKQLAKTLFPVGEMQKTEVRKIAKKYKLPNADKKDSQGVCFLGQIKLPDFLADFVEEKKGEILDEAGQVLGKHKGVHNFTIGQRHGLGVGGFKEPHYVAEKDLKRNKIVLAPSNDQRIYKKELVLDNLNFLKKLKSGEKVKARFRYRQLLQSATLKKIKKDWVLVFNQRQKFVATGQSAVFYDQKGERLLGGGIIIEAN